MKAAVINAPNAEVHIEERDRPSPGRGEVLIMFTPAASVTAT